MAAINLFEGLHIPKIQGRRALLILNCSKDAFCSQDKPTITNPPDFLDRIRKIIPHYRATETQIVWVTTLPPPGAKGWDVKAYMPSRQQEEERARLDETEKDKKQGQQDEHWVGKQGTPSNALPVWKSTDKGAELVDELADMVDYARDIMVTKHYYSAFDETPLLMSLRSKLVTEVHLCGGLSNISIIYTAAEAAQHGFSVSVVEDCMGWRSAKLHLEAMRQMADEIGVHGVDSDEIVHEAGGIAPPDADPDIFNGPGFNGINISTTQVGDGMAVDEAIVADSPSKPRFDDFVPNPNDDSSQVASKERRSKIGEGDCKVITNALSASLGMSAFPALKYEVSFQSMRHRTGDVPRRVAVQGEVDPSGAAPVYRHPADECPPLTPFSPTVLAIRNEISQLMNQHFNHVLIQLYRSGDDHISEHTDKTLDIVRGSNIVNVSLGAQRKMTLRVKKSAQTKEQQARGEKREGQKVTLPHNSVFVLGPATNARWLHGVRPDKRLDAEKSEAEKAYGGERISLTFRNIGTWTDEKRQTIWGQGARSKTREEIGASGSNGLVKPADSDEAEGMIVAFGRENQQSNFDWDKEYGRGFDALDLVIVNPR